MTAESERKSRERGEEIGEGGGAKARRGRVSEEVRWGKRRRRGRKRRRIRMALKRE